MKQEVTFFGGLDTIGGIAVLVGCGDTGIVFDLGRTPTGYFGWQSGNITPFEHKLKNYLLLKCAPPVLGIYSPEFTGDITMEELEGIWGRHLPRYKNLYVFVSHIHQDHMELLPFIREGITVFMHEEALTTYSGVVECGEYLPAKATLRGLSDMERVRLSESMSIQVLELDHDTPGSSGILVIMPESKLFFTGDFRLHGSHSQRVWDKADLLARENISLLLTEGTSLGFENILRERAETNENELQGLYRKVLENAPALVYINILCRNIERVADFINVTKACGRKLVMDAQTAVLWYRVRDRIKALADNPAINDHDTILLMEGEEKGDLPYKTISIRDIASDKARYAVYLTYQKLGLMSELEKLGERKGASHYFQADGNPLHDRDEVLLYWLKNLNIKYHYHATGGHAIPAALTKFAAAAAPKAVIPLHSVHPSIFDAGNLRKILPHYGMTIDITDL